MALSNSQYDSLMRSYEQRQLDNRHVLMDHYEEAYARIPSLQEIDNAISSLSIKKARMLLEGDKEALVSFREELRALSDKKAMLLEEAGFPADFLEIRYHCPDCKDTGLIGSRKCHCFLKESIKLLYKDSHLDEVLEEENFDTFSLDYYATNHIDPVTGRSSKEAATIAYEACRNFVSNFAREDSNLLLYGDTGVGKTFLTHCIAKELMDTSYSVIYFSAASLFDTLADHAFNRRDTEDMGERTHIFECDLLIIDDLGTELVNSFTTSQLFNCLNERISRRKATIISTNLSLEDMKSTYSERIFSRVSSNFKMLRLTGDDIRIQKRLLNLGGTKYVTP